MASYDYIVSGRVQGVGYRYFVMRVAKQLGVAGFVRNLPDGRVEVVAEGSEAALAELEAQLRAGPSFASVEGVDRSPITPRGDQEFHIR
jgi:acylphosphatase